MTCFLHVVKHAKSHRESLFPKSLHFLEKRTAEQQQEMASTNCAAGVSKSGLERSQPGQKLFHFLISHWLLPKQEAGPNRLIKLELMALYAPVPLRLAFLCRKEAYAPPWKGTEQQHHSEGSKDYPRVQHTVTSSPLPCCSSWRFSLDLS